MENDLCTLAGRRDPGFRKLRIDAFDLVVVEALAQRFVKADPEPVVDPLECREARLVDAPPQRKVLGVAGLELHKLGPRNLHDFRVRLGRGIPYLIEALELVDGVALERGLVQVALAGPDKLAVLGAPVADVVVANHPGARESEKARDGFPDHGRTQVAHVHLLRRVGRAVVDHPRFPRMGRGRPRGQVLPGRMGLEPAEEELGAGREIYEARAGYGHLEPLADGAGKGGGNGLGHGPRRVAGPLGGRQHAVRLEIAMPWIGGAHARLERPGLDARGGGGGPEGPFELADQIELTVHPATPNQPGAGARKESMGRFGSTF